VDDVSLILAIGFELFSTAILAFTFRWLSRKDDSLSDHYFSLAFSVYFLGIFSTLLGVKYGIPALQWLNHILFIVAAVFLARGAWTLLHRRFPQIIYSFAVLGIILTTAGHLIPALDLFRLSAPAFSLAAITFLTGLHMVRNRAPDVPDLKAAGIVFILNAIHQADYPFLREVDWFAPIGFSISAALLMALSVSLLIASREQNALKTKQSDRRFHDIFESTSDGLLLLNGTKIIDHNPGFLQMTGLSHTQILGADWITLSPETQPDDKESTSSFSAFLKEARMKGRSRFPWAFRHKEDEFLLTEITLNKLHSPEPDQFIAIVRSKKITQSQEDFLSIAQQAFHLSNEGIIFTDLKGTILWANPASFEITGWAAHEAIGKNPRVFKSDRHSPEFYQDMWQKLLNTGFWSGEIWNRRKNGEPFPARLKLSRVRNREGKITGYIGLMSDISQVKQQEADLQNAALYDPLTGLPKREYFLELLRQYMDLAGPTGFPHLLAIDINQFNRINSINGHLLGDEFLRQFVEILKATFPEAVYICRLGGDRFVVTLNTTNPRELYQLTEQLFRTINSPIQVSGHEISCSISMGVYLLADLSEEPANCLRKVESALTNAKSKGRNQQSVYSSDRQLALQQSMDMERRLFEAIREGNIIPFYQPKVDPKTGRVRGMEALARWREPDGTLISPAQFIPLAEETGLIIQIGESILQQACQDTLNWQMQGFDDLIVSVNLSVEQFNRTNIEKTVADILRHTRLAPDRLELEITESVFLNNASRHSSTLNKLQELGVRLSLDDFGTGYSSLSYLRHMPLQTLKIDKSFIDEVPDNPRAVALLQSILQMAENLGIETIAEGVEEEVQMGFMRTTKCNLIQGFYYSKPLVYSDFTDYVRTKNS